MQDGSGLQFINFYFVTGQRKSKFLFCGILRCLIVIFSLQFIFVCVHHFWRFFFLYFQDNKANLKQTPGIIMKTRYFSRDRVTLSTAR